KVFFERGVKLPHFGTIEGPAYIGEGSELRPGVYIRQNVIVGKRCVLGNSCEFKNCLLLNDVQAPHFNYVGDSILGNHSHLGAGVILANLRLDSQPIRVKTLNGFIDTGMRKLGAVLGDSAQVACNSVLNPGTLVKPHQHVLPRR
ncbi:MAG TPA: UDP-N-acetylglucosamine diphosphorylase, partial [Opitutae bacterium]|nr:UDP-N-acetylglucosamine diphosphorylase [Opitutae bacterium]